MIFWGPFHKAYLGLSYILVKNFFLSSVFISFIILVVSSKFLNYAKYSLRYFIALNTLIY